MHCASAYTCTLYSEPSLHRRFKSLLHKWPAVASFHAATWLDTGRTNWVVYLHSSNFVFSFFPFVVWLSLHPKWKEKKSNEWKNECWEKPQKCTCMSNVLVIFISPRGALQFDTTAGYSYHWSIFSWRAKPER